MSAENTPQEQDIPAEEMIAEILVDEDFDPALENLHRKFSVCEWIRAVPGGFFSLALTALLVR